jgi:hypothetical protein
VRERLAGGVGHLRGRAGREQDHGRGGREEAQGAFLCVFWVLGLVGVLMGVLGQRVTVPRRTLGPRTKNVGDIRPQPPPTADDDPAGPSPSAHPPNRYNLMSIKAFSGFGVAWTGV